MKLRACLITAVVGFSAISQAAVEKNKCTDIKNSEKLLKEQIVKRVRDAQKAGLQPAGAYEDGPDVRVNATASVDHRASKQAGALASALFAAVNKPESAANASAESLYENPNRRASLDFYAHCGAGPARKLIENAKPNYQGAGCPGDNKPLDISLSSKFVWQTNLPAEKVMQRFAKAKAQSTEGNSVLMCVSSRATCATAEGFQYSSPTDFKAVMNHDYYFQDTSILKDAVIYQAKMVNRTSSRVTPIEICGAKAYLVSIFQNGGEEGMERSSLLGLIAEVGDKTLVLGDITAQAFTEKSWALSFPSYRDDTIKKVLGSGYKSVADAIQAIDRPVLGEVSGSPAQKSGSTPMRRLSSVQ